MLWLDPQPIPLLCCTLDNSFLLCYNVECEIKVKKKIDPANEFVKNLVNVHLCGVSLPKKWQPGINLPQTASVMVHCNNLQ